MTGTSPNCCPLTPSSEGHAEGAGGSTEAEGTRAPGRGADSPPGHGGRNTTPRGPRCAYFHPAEGPAPTPELAARPDEPVTAGEARGVEVAAAPAPDGLLDGFVGAILGFLFG